ncbi:unnamed protein product [Candidula unifasciata]|uniref:C2H2-type domain-containing protein n=1 Tax=Candidula unifasciata TaxID=100452 RepID=A0A8S3ZE53_9EUPU|nr:unnamed protein product [Candidula unifasciata]
MERPRLLQENERSFIHPALRPQLGGNNSHTCGIRPGNEVRIPANVNPSTLTSSAAMTPCSSTLPLATTFQGLQLPSIPPNGLNLGMLSAMTNLAAVSNSVHATNAALPSQLLPYPGMFPNHEELRYLSMAQIQAANQAHLAGEVAKLKPPFLTRNYLELAMLVCNTFRGKLFPCPHCRYVTDRRNNLKRHIATMHQACDKQLECCGVTFSTKASLREHITIFHHNGYSCPFCGRRFCRKALLKRHLSVHSGQKDYTCPSCDYATSHKSNLERHKRIHARLQILGASGLDESESHSCKIFQENDTRMGTPSLAQAFPKDHLFRNSFSTSMAESWADKLRDGTFRGSTTNNVDDQDDCEIDIDDDNDDDDDDDSDVIIDACSDDSRDVDSQPVSTTLRLNIKPEVTNLPVNLVTPTNARACAAATMAARLTNGFLPYSVAAMLPAVSDRSASKTSKETNMF